MSVLRMVLLATVTLILMQVSPVVWGCRCPPFITPAEAYRYAHVVVQAEVLHLIDDTVQHESVATVAVAQSWKTAVPANLKVYTARSCAYAFAKGEIALLYLRWNEKRDRWETSRCVGNQVLHDADQVLSWLKKHGKNFQPMR